MLDVRSISRLMAAPTPTAATPKNTRSKSMAGLEISLAAKPVLDVRSTSRLMADGDAEEHQIGEHDRARD